jgi:hypothetical protein
MKLSFLNEKTGTSLPVPRLVFHPLQPVVPVELISPCSSALMLPSKSTKMVPGMLGPEFIIIKRSNKSINLMD